MGISSKLSVVDYPVLDFKIPPQSCSNSGLGACERQSGALRLGLDSSSVTLGKSFDLSGPFSHVYNEDVHRS